MKVLPQICRYTTLEHQNRLNMKEDVFTYLPVLLAAAPWWQEHVLIFSYPVDDKDHDCKITYPFRAFKVFFCLRQDMICDC